MRVVQTLFVILLASAALGGTLAPAAAQSAPEIERLGVALWPEYDQPEVLVIYRASLSPDAAYPAVVTLPIPASAGDPFAVAVQGPDGSLLYAEGYERTVQGEWALISFAADTPEVQLEYYAPLAREGNQRRFAFTWPGGFDLGSFGYEVQHPAGATDMVIAPEPQARQTRGDGLVYSTAELGPLAAGETFGIDVEYSRTTEALTVDLAQSSSPAVTTAEEPGPALEAYLPWALGLLGLALVGVGGGLWIRSRRQPSAASARRRPRRSRPPKDDQPSLDAGRVFCHQCGAQGAVSDAYCRRCGAKLRN